MTLLIGVHGEWNNDLLQGDAPMLESSIEIIHKMIVIVGIDKVGVFLCKNKAGADVLFGQLCIVRRLDMENVLADKAEVFALLVA